MIYETRTPRRTQDDRLTEKFTRRETEHARRQRIKRQKVDPATAKAILFLARAECRTSPVASLIAYRIVKLRVLSC